MHILCNSILLLASIAAVAIVLYFDWKINKSLFSEKIKNLGQFLLGLAALFGVAQIPNINVSQNVINNLNSKLNSLQSEIYTLQEQNELLKNKINSIQNSNDDKPPGKFR